MLYMLMGLTFADISMIARDKCNSAGFIRAPSIDIDASLVGWRTTRKKSKTYPARDICEMSVTLACLEFAITMACNGDFRHYSKWAITK